MKEEKFVFNKKDISNIAKDIANIIIAGNISSMLAFYDRIEYYLNVDINNSRDFWVGVYSVISSFKCNNYISELISQNLHLVENKIDSFEEDDDLPF